MMRRGFTIIELLIVIVIMSIMSVAVVVSYGAVQGRAHDSRRLSDAQAIVKSLNVYKAINGQYPAATPSCWESSSNSLFMEYLTVDYGLAKVPIDPVNQASFIYQYCKYPAGTYGCDASRGPFVVLGIKRLATKHGSADNSNWVCSGRDWNNDHGGEFSWTWGAYEN